MDFSEEQQEYIRHEVDTTVRQIVGKVIGDIPTNDQIEKRLEAYLQTAEDMVKLRLSRQANHLHEVVAGMDASLRRAEQSVNLVYDVHGHIEGIKQRDLEQSRALAILGTLPERVSRLEMSQTALAEAIYGDPTNRQAKPGFVNIMLQDMERRNVERKELMGEINNMNAQLVVIQATINRWQGMGAMALSGVKVITGNIWGRIVLGGLGAVLAALAGADFLTKLFEAVSQMFQITP